MVTVVDTVKSATPSKANESYLTIPQDVAQGVLVLLDQAEEDASGLPALQQAAIIVQVSVVRGLTNELSTVGISTFYARSVIRALGYIGRTMTDSKEEIVPTVSAYKA